MAVCYFWELRFACCLHLNPQEMENGLQFLKLMPRSDGLWMQFFIRLLLVLLQLLGHAAGNNWHLKNKKRSFVRAKMSCMHTLLQIPAHQQLSVTSLAAEEEMWATVDWPPAMFSLQACRGELWCYFPFHTLVKRSNIAFPIEKLLFYRSIPCLGRE